MVRNSLYRFRYVEQVEATPKTYQIPVPIYLAALRPRMIEMAAEYGDGVIFNLWPKSALPQMLEHVAIGAKRASKRLEDIEIVNRFVVIVTDDKKDGYDRFRQQFIPYFANPVYNKYLNWCGYSNEAEALSAAWAARDREGTAEAFTDELCDQIAVIGTAEECRDRIRLHAEQGITTSIIAPLARLDRELAYETLEAFMRGQFFVLVLIPFASASSQHSFRKNDCNAVSSVC